MYDKPQQPSTKPPLPDWAAPPPPPPIQSPPQAQSQPQQPLTEPFQNIPTEPQPPTPEPETERPEAPASPPPFEPPPPPPPLTSQPAPRSPFSPSVFLKIFLGILVVAVIISLSIFAFSFVKNRISPPQKEVTLTYWGLWEDKNIMDSVLLSFQKEHPNIKVNYEKRDIKQYRETLKTRLSQGSGPDVFRFHNSWLPMFKDSLSPLPKTVLGESPKDDFYPVVTKDLVKDGVYFGVPLEIETLVLFANKNLLGNATSLPKTWNDLKSLAPTLTVKDSEGKIKISGIALGTFDNITHGSDIISLMFLQNGVDFKNLPQTSTNLQDALEFYTAFARGPTAVWDETLDSSLLAFAKGNLALFFGYSWDVFTIKAINPDLEFIVANAPQLSEGEKVALASYWVEGVSKKSKNQKAAFELLAYLNKKENLQKLYSEAAKTRLFGEPYARVELGQQLSNNPYLAPVVEQAKYALSTPFSSDTFDNGLNSELNKYLDDSVRSILSNTSPESAVETLIKGINQVMTKYGAF